MFKPLALFVIAAPLLAAAQGNGANGSRATGADVWQIWRTERDVYQQRNPCPVNGKKVGNCPGYRIGLVVPLRRGGDISVKNMRWMTNQEYDQTQQNMPEP